jgi:aspartate aminotransferase
LADKAKERGIKVFHLNIGQPDLHTPPEALAAIKNIDRKVLEYSPSEGSVRSVRNWRYTIIFLILMSAPEILLLPPAEAKRLLLRS